MPKPEVMLIKGMKPKACADALKKIDEWSNTSEVSSIKKSILTSIIGYAKEHFINHMDSISDASYPDLRDLEICNAIFQQTDLSDVLFMQYVINQVRNGHDFTFFKNIEQKATDCLHALKIPTVYETRGTAGVLGVFSLLANTRVGMLASVLLFVFSDYVVDWRINNSLENKLALKKIGGTPPKIEDGYDGVNKGVFDFAKSTYSYTTQFFQKKLVPWLSKQVAQNETKESPPGHSL